MERRKFFSKPFFKTHGDSARCRQKLTFSSLLGAGTLHFFMVKKNIEKHFPYQMAVDWGCIPIFGHIPSRTKSHRKLREKCDLSNEVDSLSNEGGLATHQVDTKIKGFQTELQAGAAMVVLTIVSTAFGLSKSWGTPNSSKLC